MTRLIKSPLRYPGGKSRAVERILKLIPATITEFREPFVGGGSVFLAVKSVFGKRIERYHVNDLNQELMCFWQAARDEIDGLINSVIAYRKQYAKDGRALYTLLKDPQFAQSDLERAVRFFILNRITFSGIAESGGYSEQSFERRFTESSIQRLRDVARHLAQVAMTNDDYEALLHAPGENVFIFLDPPYWVATDSRLYGQRGNLHTSFEHARFAEAMRRCPHRWLITYDDSPVIRELFAFAHISEWQLQYGMNNYKQGKADKGNELFIRNY